MVNAEWGAVPAPLLQEATRNDPHTTHHAHWLLAGGGQVRTAQVLAQRPVVVDRCQALVPIPPSGASPSATSDPPDLRAFVTDQLRRGRGKVTVHRIMAALSSALGEAVTTAPGPQPSQATALPRPATAANDTCGPPSRPPASYASPMSPTRSTPTSSNSSSAPASAKAKHSPCTGTTSTARPRPLHPSHPLRRRQQPPAADHGPKPTAAARGSPCPTASPTPSKTAPTHERSARPPPPAATSSTATATLCTPSTSSTTSPAAATGPASPASPSTTCATSPPASPPQPASPCPSSPRPCVTAPCPPPRTSTRT